MIYVIRLKDCTPSFIKVGYSKTNPVERISALQTGSPFEYEIIKTMKGSQQTEKEFHAKLSSFKVRGEWFRDCFEVRSILGVGHQVTIQETELSETQKTIIDFFTDKHECVWTIETVAKLIGVKREDLEGVPFKSRNFHIGFTECHKAKVLGKYYGEEYSGKRTVVLS